MFLTSHKETCFLNETTTNTSSSYIEDKTLKSSFVTVNNGTFFLMSYFLLSRILYSHLFWCVHFLETKFYRTQFRGNL